MHGTILGKSWARNLGFRVTLRDFRSSMGLQWPIYCQSTIRILFMEYELGHGIRFMVRCSSIVDVVKLAKYNNIVYLLIKTETMSRNELLYNGMNVPRDLNGTGEPDQYFSVNVSYSRVRFPCTTVWLRKVLVNERRRHIRNVFSHHWLKLCSAIGAKWAQGLFSQSDKTSYRQISKPRDWMI